VHDRPIYLDFAATTPVDPRVADLVYHVMTEEFGNAGSRTHIWGTEAKKLVERAREQVAAVVEASPDEVIFTSGATESNNLAILGLSEFGLAEGKRHIISTQIEHKAVLEPLQEMERRGFEVTLLPPNSGGWVPAEEVAKALRPDTLLVSVMHVNNETGIIQPIEEICQVLADHPAYFHMDAAQGFGKELTAPRLKRVDLISISGHKIYAPKGIGALVTRRRRFKRPPLKSLMFGGGQEFGLRPGTLPVPITAGFGLAAELALVEADSRRRRCSTMAAFLDDSFTSAGFSGVGDLNRRVYCVAAYKHPTLDSEFTIMALRNTCSLSNGAACSSTQYSASHVFASIPGVMEHPEKVVRLSWSHNSEKSQMAELLRSLMVLSRS
jgi:cysteine desulfurase